MTSTNHLTTSQRLRMKIELPIRTRTTIPRSLSLYHRDDIRAVYPQYLIAVHSVTRASVNLLESAAQACMHRKTTDKLANHLYSYFEEHIEEERGHDEWILQDLEVTGFSRKSVLDIIPSSIAATLVGRQYYWINDVHPAIFLGYMETLEGYPPHPDLVPFLVERTGYPCEAFRTLERHSYIDQDHRDDLHQVIDSAPITPPIEKMISINALDTIILTQDLFRDVISNIDRE